MKRIFICLYISMTMISCLENSIIKVKAEFEGEEDIIINTPIDIEDFYLFTLQHKLIKLTGIEKLKNIKRLKIIELPGFTDYSFLTKLPNIEELFINGAKIGNFGFSKYCTKLKIFHVAGAQLDDFIIDFLSNKELESVALNNLHDIKRKPFSININNIPESLKYLDLHLNTELIITQELLESIKNVEYVFLPTEVKDKFPDFFKINANFKFCDSLKAIPIEYQQKTLSTKTEYGLDYF